MGCLKLTYQKEPVLKVISSKKELTSLKSKLKGRISYPFGMPLPGRQFNANSYDFGFNGMLKDDEVKGGGNSLDFGARIYDSRLGRFLSLDPRAPDFPFMSPYCYAANNPVYFIDKFGEGPEPADPGQPDGKMGRKYKRWKKKNKDLIKGKRPDEQLDLFLDSKTRGGKSVREKKWANKWLTVHDDNQSTGWIFETEDMTEVQVIEGEAETNRGGSDKTEDIGISEGELEINYDMRAIPDRLRVEDSEGNIIFDTANDPNSNRQGKVSQRKGSGVRVPFKFKNGDTTIRIIVNDGNSDSTAETAFTYQIKVHPKKKSNGHRGKSHHPK